MQWEESLTHRIDAGEAQERDREFIVGFIRNEMINKPLSPNTIYTLMDRLISILKVLRGVGMHDIRTATTQQFSEAAGKIREKYPKANTQRMHLNGLKRFCKYLVDEKKIRRVESQRIQGIKLPPTNWKSKTSEDLLTPDELEKAIEDAGTVRNRAIIAMFADGCFHPIEIRTMRWDQLMFDEYGIRVKVAEKTKYEREFRLTFSTPYLLRWKENYPDGKPEGNKPVFVNERKSKEGKYEPLGNDALKNLVYQIRDKTGIKKLKPSIFRPTGLTQAAEAGTDHAYLCIKGWGNMNTQMVRTYVKPSREHMDRIALAKMGVSIPEDKKLYRTEKLQDLLKPKTCPNPRCKTINPSTQTFCGACGIPLTADKEESAKYQEEGENWFDSLPLEDQFEFLRWRKKRRDSVKAKNKP